MSNISAEATSFFPRTVSDELDLTERERVLIAEIHRLDGLAGKETLASEIRDEQMYWLKETVSTFADIAKNCGNMRVGALRDALMEALANNSADF